MKPPLSASDIIPEDWNRIARDIGSKYLDYDAFIILHGKDTIVYTASALSFMLENLTKPVILTDKDLVSSMILGSENNYPEVMISSKNTLFRGCNCCRTISYSSFRSPNYPKLNEKNCLSQPSEPFQIKFINPKIKVNVIKLFPAINSNDLKGISNANGIVLETYGIGNSPTTKDFMLELKRLIDNGIIVVSVSQNNKILNNSNMDVRLLKIGVISCYDMTTEAAVTKLYFLLSNVENKKLIRKLMDVNFRGEMNKYEE